MSNKLSIDELEISEQIYQAHRLYRDFEESKYKAGRREGYVDTLPMHEETVEELEKVLEMYAASCDKDMQAVIDISNHLLDCDMNMSLVVASSPVARYNRANSRQYQNKTRSYKGKSGGHR